MSPQKPFQREPDGMRLAFHGIDTVHPPDKLKPGKYPFAMNVRAYLRDRITGRSLLSDPLFTSPFGSPVHSIRRLNDSTPLAPPFGPGYVHIEGEGTNLHVDNFLVDTGYSGNPLSLVPFRPNASIQPWMYVGDSVKMTKVVSTGQVYKMGIAEPQAPPVIASVPASDHISLVGAVTVTYWGDSPHSGPTGNYIWKNAGDPGGAGPVRSAKPPNGSTTGNSILFDVSTGDQSVPMAWTVFAEYSGTVSTSGTSVTWDSGSQFNGLSAGNNIVINGVTYTIAASPPPTNTTLSLTSSAGTQTAVNYSAAAIAGTTPVFTPALESEGYSDFNFVLEATLYVPTAGAYTFVVNSKDEFLWGIGNSGSGTATWNPPTGGQVLSLTGQTKTAKNGYPLIPKTVTPDGAGQTDVGSQSITFSQAGNYPLEIDYDFWYHSGRTLKMKANGVDITPLPGSVVTNAQYRYTYRSSLTGAVSNPSPPSMSENLSVIANQVQVFASTDPQVDKIDIYRRDLGLTNYTYVGTQPNGTSNFSDTLLDTEVANNPILEFDNFEPFPSIDTTHAGLVNVSGGVATWAGGGKFNVRWLPGTVIIVGSIAYTLDKRPTDTTHLTATIVELIGGVEVSVPIADGNGQNYEIAEPILAAQPLPYMWGPTDNINFAFACGDPLRPGVLYWSKGNNLDSAPDTNQQDVTSPSEPLQNGVLTEGFGMVFSSERAWIIMPNFFNALATVAGTVGSTWTLQGPSLNRGLYIPRALAADGGGNIFFRVKDGIHISPGGLSSKSITDDDIYNLFPHEGFLPQPVVRAGFTITPPDDSQPQAQKMNVANGYLYYDYLDVLGNPRTLVYDIAAGGWVWDAYVTPVVVHVLDEGPKVNGTVVGCQDGNVRTLSSSGTENPQSIVLMPCYNAGETRADKRFGDVYVEAGLAGS